MNPEQIGALVKSVGKHMPRQKYQRPKVKAWIGKGGTKYWKVDYFVYLAGREKPKHKAKTWLQKEFTKSAAQEEADKLIREQTSGTAKPDGAMTVAEFWDRVYMPVCSRRVAPNTKSAYESSWRTHVKPYIGQMQIQDVTKNAIDTVLGKIVDAGRGREVVNRALLIMSELFSEAAENDFIAKNPCRAVEPPASKEPKQTRPLTLDEVRKLFDGTTGRDNIIWRTMVLCGLRIGECLALVKADITPAGLVVDESAYEKKAAQTKNRKTRLVPLPAALRESLVEWGKAVDGDLLFPAADGSMLCRKGAETDAIIYRARKIISGITWRTCRTTFATHFDGDPRDLQAALGHASVNLSFGTYRKPQAERQQASADDLEARLSGKVVPIERKKLFNSSQTRRKSG